MKKILLILALLIPMIALAQSREANKLYKQGRKLYHAEKYKEAIFCLQKCDSLDKAILKPTSKKYYRGEISIAYCLNNLALEKYYQGNYQEAIRLGTEAMEIKKKVLGEEHPSYATSLDNLAGYYDELGNYQEAIRLCTEAMEIRKKVLGKEHPDYAISLNNLASYYDALGNYQEAIRLGTEAMEIWEKVLGEEHPDYATSLNNLASYYDALGNYQEAIRLCTEAMEIRKKVLGEEHPDYATSLSNLAGYYDKLGNYQEAIRLSTEAMEIRKKVLGEEHPDYATSLNNLAGYYDALGNYQEALRLGTEALEIYKKVLGEEHPDYAASLNNMSFYYSKLGNYQEAIRLGTEALEISEKILGEEHPDYATSLNNLANSYSNLGNYQEAIRLGTEAMEIRKKVLGEEHPDYANSLNNMAVYYYKDGKYDEATELYEQTFKLRETLIKKTFAYLTTKERSEFWNMYSDFFNDYLPYLAYHQPNSTLKSLALNGQLLSKGLLLNAELEIQSLIEQQGNAHVKDIYYKIRQDRNTLDELYQLPLNKWPMDADSLSKAIDKEERLLVESCQEIGDYTKNLSIKWEDIQAKLKDDDIAIEFANFTEESSENEIYIALIIKKGMKSPELVKLDYAETDTVKYSTPTLYNKIWKPIDKYLKGVQNVYFSPSGKFHTIAIESLPDENRDIFAQKFNAYRLSSTRELALDHVVNTKKMTSVYGGIVYNFDESDWQNINNDNEDDALRAGITFLKGAKKESEEITKILRDNSFNVEYSTDKAATEESFKQLSGSGIKILHMATHGFYEPEEKENNVDNMLSVGDKGSKEDLSLSRSGLYLAGANTALDPEQRKLIPDGVDDGILTAKEISRMDFKGLDLVVLSACQTGLGEVTGEGVFGLQRGFKKAGAQTIIMSLWNVNDKPTRDLMTEFYRNIVAGKTKREAFITAQDKVRQKYLVPQMWAGFIMVDGME